MVKCLSLREMDSRKVGSRWQRDGGEERKGKREEKRVFQCQHVDISSALFISHPSVRGVGGRPCLERPHTCLAFRKLCLEMLVGIINGEVTQTVVVCYVNSYLMATEITYFLV